MQSRARLLLEKELFKIKKEPVWVSCVRRGLHSCSEIVFNLSITWFSRVLKLSL